MIEQAIRCYARPLPKVISKVYHGEKSFIDDYNDIPSFDRVLVFDTETTNDQFQNLKFGSVQVYHYDKLKFQYIFYDHITEKELAILQEYSKNHNIPLITVAEFIDNIFHSLVYDLKTVCIGFNLPFDLSRLIFSFGDARGRNKGGFSLKLSENPENPRVIIKHLDSKRAFISFSNAFSRKRGNVRNKKGQSNKFRGHFLDLRTFTFALTNESHTLESACELFNTDIKKSIAEEHGKITPEYIDYNINDVNATYSLFCKTIEEFKKYNLSISPTKIYSPASLGKAYLKAMDIKSFQELNPTFPKEILGYVMQTYYGGK